MVQRGVDLFTGQRMHPCCIVSKCCASKQLVISQCSKINDSRHSFESMHSRKMCTLIETIQGETSLLARRRSVIAEKVWSHNRVRLDASRSFPSVHAFPTGRRTSDAIFLFSVLNSHLFLYSNPMLCLVEHVVPSTILVDKSMPYN